MGFQKARRLSEVSAAVEITPLESDDVRYQDMSAGRVSDDLLQMKELLGDYEASSGRYAKIAITGHRGCGKSTELLRLEHEVGERFTCLHVVAENALIIDYDYTDLFLWLTDALIRKFAELSMP